MCHLCFTVFSVLAADGVNVDVFGTTRTFRLSSDEKQQRVTSIAIKAHCQDDTRFDLFAAFQLLGCQQIIRL